MKTISVNQVKFFELDNLYQVAYEQKYVYNIDLFILKPIDLSPENLEKQPIKILFIKIKNAEILAEIKINSQTQLAEVFKILQKLRVTKQAIANILVPLLSNWLQDLQENGVENIIYPNASVTFHKAMSQNEK